MRTTGWRIKAFVASAFLSGYAASGSESLRAAVEPVARIMGLGDPPTPASANALSEHEVEGLDSRLPRECAVAQAASRECDGASYLSRLPRPRTALRSRR